MEIELILCEIQADFLEIYSDFHELLLDFRFFGNPSGFSSEIDSIFQNRLGKSIRFFGYPTGFSNYENPSELQNFKHIEK